MAVNELRTFRDGAVYAVRGEVGRRKDETVRLTPVTDVHQTQGVSDDTRAYIIIDITH